MRNPHNPDILSIWGKQYDRTPKSALHTESEDAGRMVWIVRIYVESGEELINARIFATQDECDGARVSWVNGLLRANPGKFLRSVTERAKDQY